MRRWQIFLWTDPELLHLFWYLNLFQIMFPLLVSSLADTVLTISIYQEPEMCAVFKQNPFHPCVIDQMKRYREKKEEDVHLCLPDVLRNVCLSRLCSARKKTKVGTVLPCPQHNCNFPFPRCYVWHTSWRLPQLLPLGSAYVTHLYARNPLVTS